jgi:hypothetical protein
VLLNEQVPRGLAGSLLGHEVRALTQMGWKGLSNGRLLATAGGRFDVMITMEKRMPLDRDLSQYQVGVVLVRAGSNRLEALLPWFLPFWTRSPRSGRVSSCALVPNKSLLQTVVVRHQDSAAHSTESE